MVDGEDEIVDVDAVEPIIDKLKTYLALHTMGLP